MARRLSAPLRKADDLYQNACHCESMSSASPSTAQPLTLGNAVTDSIAAGQAGYYTINLTAGDCYTFSFLANYPWAEHCRIRNCLFLPVADSCLNLL